MDNIYQTCSGVTFTKSESHIKRFSKYFTRVLEKEFFEKIQKQLGLNQKKKQF